MHDHFAMLAARRVVRGTGQKQGALPPGASLSEPYEWKISRERFNAGALTERQLFDILQGKASPFEFLLPEGRP